MKKIIYSLVIMIAAGSLFTSCIEPVEPAGIYDLREAKARYYDALSKLRAADALLVEAQADHEKANAEFRRAQVENQNLLNEAQRLANEAQALGNEQEAARWAMRIEELKKQHELNMINYETQIAQAKEAQRQALSAIAMAALDLTDAEKQALATAIREYERAYNNYLDALERVANAEAALWEAQYAFDNATDDEEIYFDFYGDEIAVGEDLIEYYKDCVDYYAMYAAYYAALYEEFAENSDAAAWAEELEDLKAQLQEREYNRYQVTKDSVEYMQNVFHDGNIEFGLEVAAWMEENKAVAKPTAPKEPKESSYKAADYEADSIEFPVYKYDLNKPADAKLISLLSSYYKLNAPLGVDSTSFIIDTTGKKIVINANQPMKDFVLGTATSTVESQEWAYTKDGDKVELVADYGLNGALSVLKRELVIKKGTVKTKEQLEKELKEAKELWQADHDTLLAFYEAVAKAEDDATIDPYLAYKPIADAKAALKKAQDDAKSESGSLVKAAEAIITTLNGIITHDDCSSADSLKMVEAFVEFAKHREAYLDWTFDKEKHAKDSNYFVYPIAVTPKLILDSVKFTDLKFADFVKAGSTDSYYSYKTDGNKPTSTECSNVKVWAFYNVASQLLGATIAEAIGKMAATNPALPMAAINNGTKYTAFYSGWKYDDSTNPATIKTAAGETYTPKAVTEAEKALTAAVAAFNACFERYWDVNPSADGVAFTLFAEGGTYENYTPAVYSVESFTVPFNVVNFDEGKDVIWTAAIGAILGSVDPKAKKADGSDLKTGAKVDKTKSAIFHGNDTDFYAYMYAAWALENEDLEAAIEKIEKWINAVVAAFAKDVTDAEAAAKAAYETAKKNYETAKKTYDTNKAKYDAYTAELKKFVGTDEDGELINVVKNSAGAYVPSVTSIAVPTNYTSANVNQTQTGAFEWKGEWKLGGTQKELAEKYMPQYPEKLAGWRSVAKENEDEIGHLKAIIKVVEDALMAAIGVAEDMDPAVIKAILALGDYSTDVEGYYQLTLDYLQSVAEYYLSMVTIFNTAVERAEAGYDPAQLAIMVLEDNLAYAEQLLADAEVKLAVAQAYYEKVLAAIEGKN